MVVLKQVVRTALRAIAPARTRTRASTLPSTAGRVCRAARWDRSPRAVLATHHPAVPAGVHAARGLSQKAAPAAADGAVDGGGGGAGAAAHVQWELCEAVSDSVFEAAGGEAALGGMSEDERARHLVEEHAWHPLVAHQVAGQFGDRAQARAALQAVWSEGASPGAASVLAMYEDAVRKFKHNAFLGYWIMDTLYPLGAWKTISYFQLSLLVHDIRQLLHNQGVREGARVALISRNSVEWFAFALATYGLRAEFVALPEEMAAADWLDALADAQPAVVWCGGKETYDTVVQAVRASKRRDVVAPFGEDQGVLVTDRFFCIDGIDGIERWDDHALTHLLKQFRDKKVNRQSVPRIPPQYPAPGDVALVTYRIEGGGGVRRAAYTHAQVLSHALVAEIHNPTPARESSLSLVPWCEVSALTHELLAMARKGARVYAAEGRLRLRYNCQELAPTVVHTRADVLKVFAESFLRDAVHEKVYDWALQAAIDAVRAQQTAPAGEARSVGDRCRAALARRLLARTRSLIGGRLRKVVCHGRGFPAIAERVLAALDVQMEVVTGVPGLAGLPVYYDRSAATITYTKWERLRAAAMGEKLVPRRMRALPLSLRRALAGLEVVGSGELVSGTAPHEYEGRNVRGRGVLFGGGVEDGFAERACVLYERWRWEENSRQEVTFVPGRVEEALLGLAPLVMQACVVALGGGGPAVIVAVPDAEALGKLHQVCVCVCECV